MAKISPISMSNQSTISEFILIGFPGLQQKFHIPVSVTMFLVYCVSLVANSSVIILVLQKEQLHQPMYIIIRHLALSDLLFDTITLPKIIAKYWFGAGSITFYGCFFQLFCVHNLGSLDSFIIMLMAIDRYVAICQPLRYHSIISNKTVTLLCYFLWAAAALIGSIVAAITGQLPYCGPNRVKNCFCVNSAVAALACVDVTLARRTVFTLAMCVLLLPLAFIILSYVLIIRVIHSSSNTENSWKAFYTCSTHLMVIGLYYIPRVFVYSTGQIPLTLDADINVLLLCLYTFIPHLSSPVIYCLRTKDIRNIFAQSFDNIFHAKI
ncbi:olfactory receptor 688 [Xenopus tropicalis]|uniref:Olfactory receptor n=1 Tax=Xenopus tropicalis TaxID=8364 RepID=A0A8J0SZT4_XENTR|nr:olfactory receptor 688 [Xenopus tropicalis]